MNQSSFDQPITTNFQAGFVNIIGKPNVGKSTLINQILGQKLSIVTHKLQTTRHRILGILNTKNSQVVFSDTPGIILSPQYALHHAMMQNVNTAFKDADIILWIIDSNAKEEFQILERIKKTNIKTIIVLNKTDLYTPHTIQASIAQWKKHTDFDVLAISALKNISIDSLLQKILQHLPQHPPYYPLDALTDKSERFFAGEIIREKIFEQYHQEIPYSTAVVITNFKHHESIIYIQADIYVESISQKIIVIGKQGKSLQKLSTAASTALSAFLEKKVSLSSTIKVMTRWRKQPKRLQQLACY